MSYVEPFGPDYDYGDDYCDFAEPGGESALRASSASNPRVHSCPTCGERNVLTSRDVALGYQCDNCANLAENPHLQY